MSRNSIRSKSFPWLVSVLILSLAAAFSTEAAPLRVAYVNNEANEKLMVTLKQLYEANYRGEEVELVPVSSRQLQSNIVNWMLTGETADIFLVSDPVITALKGQDIFKPMLEFRWPGFRFDEAFARFSPGVQQAFLGPRGPIGVPLTVDAELFQVNVSLFQSAGVAAPDQTAQSWNWHDMIEIGRRISHPTLNRYLLHLEVELPVIYFLVHGDVISPDFTSSRVMNEANVGILDLAQDAIHRYHISPPPSRQSNTSRLFRDGQLALRRVTVSSMQPQAVARNAGQWSHFEWDVIPWPLSPFTHQRPSLGEANGLVVSPVTRAMPQVEGFLRVAISDDGQHAVATSGSGQFPARIDLWNAMPSEDRHPPHNREAFLLALENWQHLFFPQTIVSDLPTLSAPIIAILEGRLDPQTGLEQAHHMLDAMLKQQN